MSPGLLDHMSAHRHEDFVLFWFVLFNVDFDKTSDFGEIYYGTTPVSFNNNFRKHNLFDQICRNSKTINQFPPKGAGNPRPEGIDFILYRAYIRPPE